MGSDNRGSNDGIGLLGMLFVLFTGLKLADVIDWSWWWVTSPLWGGFAVILGGFVLVFCGATIWKALKEIFKTRKK